MLAAANANKICLSAPASRLAKQSPRDAFAAWLEKQPVLESPETLARIRAQSTSAMQKFDIAHRRTPTYQLTILQPGGRLVALFGNESHRLVAASGG